MKGKCLHCASANHFANNCSLTKDIKCTRCNATGHIAAACTQTGQAKATATVEQEQEKENPSMVQLEYQLAAQTQDKFAEMRGVGSAYFAPVQSVPLPAQV